MTPVCPEAPVSPVMPLAPASDGALRADYPSLAQLTQLLGMRPKMASCDGRSVHPPVTPVRPVAPVSPVVPLAPASDGTS